MKCDVEWSQSDLNRIHDCLIGAHYEFGDEETEYNDDDVRILADSLPDSIKGFCAYVEEVETEASDMIYSYFLECVEASNKLTPRLIKDKEQKPNRCRPIYTLRPIGTSFNNRE